MREGERLSVREEGEGDVSYGFRYGSGSGSLKTIIPNTGI